MRDEKIINRYIEGESNPRETKIVQERIKSDPEFNKVYVKLSQIDQLLRKIENEEVTDDIALRVLNSVKYRNKSKSIWVRFVPVVMGSLFSFFLAITLSTLLFTHYQNNNSDSYPSEDLYSTLEIDDFVNYYYDK